MGPNPTLEKELTKRIGKEPVAVIDMQITDLLADGDKTDMKKTSSYAVTGKDIEILTKQALAEL